MNALKKTLNVFGILFAIPLSIILVVVLTVIPFYSSALTFATSKQIVKVVQSEAFTEVIVSAESVREAVEEVGLTEEDINTLLNTEVAGKMLELYTEDVLNAVHGDVDMLNLTPDAIRSLVSENMDEIVEALRLVDKIDENLTDEQIAENVNAVVEEHADSIITALPSAKDISVTFEEQGVTKVVNFVTSPALQWSVAGAAILLAAIIYGLRFPRFKGMLWVGIPTFIAGLLVLCTAIVLKSIPSLNLLSFIPEELSGLATPAILVFSGTMLGWGIGFVAGGALIIAGFITIRVLFKKKKAKAAATVTESPAAPETASDATL